MAHYARLDEDFRVIEVLVIPNDCEPTESDGIAYCQQLFGGGIWRKTSYNATIRKNYAGIGFYYDPQRDAFIPNRRYHTWRLNEETCRWEPPTPYPNDGETYLWDEFSNDWRKMS